MKYKCKVCKNEFETLNILSRISKDQDGMAFFCDADHPMTKLKLVINPMSEEENERANQLAHLLERLNPSIADEIITDEVGKEFGCLYKE
jgi:hypothetical protein